MIDVAAADEVAPGATMRIEVGEYEICIARDSDGTLHAIDDLCTHGEVSLAEGEIEDGTIECWLHGSQFDLDTGVPVTPPAFEPVAVYDCKEIAGRILVDPKTTLN